MCAVIYSSLFLILIFCNLSLEAEGLPYRRRHRGNPDDLIAGKHFLNILMDSPALHRPHRETTTISLKGPPVTLPTSLSLEHYTASSAAPSRASRSTRLVTPSDFGARLLPTPIISEPRRKLKRARQSSDSSDNRRIINVRVTSTVEEGPSILSPIKSTSSTTEQSVSAEVATVVVDSVLPVEEHPSLIAEVNKSEFNVEEADPITSNGGDSFHYNEELPAHVQALPSPKKLSDFQQTSDLLKELSRDNLKDKLQPFHHTVIYHDNPGEPNKARSVSYSTVIQSVPHNSQEKWIEGKDTDDSSEKDNEDQIHGFDEDSQTHTEEDNGEYYATGKYSSSEKEETTTKNPTEKNWGISERNYGMRPMAYMPRQQTSLPMLYGQPEQNYEVDEAVSVQTNGRTHGVQPSRPINESRAKPTSKSRQNAKKEDSPKVGYVLEGRKERRYRVEERTSDGFIVGEYGIVNHDDGLLRGVRYTADGTISPRLIYDTLMKFLSL